MNDQLQDGLTDEQKRTVEDRKTKERADYIFGLRQLAEFFERNPAMSLPADTSLNVWCGSAEEFVACRRAMGAKEKFAITDSIYVSRTFAGGIRLDANVSKDRTCKKVPTGRKIVLPEVKAVPAQEVDEYRWECGSVLSAAEGERNGEV